MKELNFSRSQNNKHEIDFCSNYSHRCFTPFYGFLKNDDKIVGFIYEFMCNDSLEHYFQQHAEECDDIVSMLMINRIFQGIEFLYKNNLIHRDLKPSNILIMYLFLILKQYDIH